MDLPTWEITEEERTRNEALFYSQKPQNGFLSGEQARALFIRSKLPLPELSKIWKLADITRDNILDVSEFVVAMHLIQSRLRGMDIPLKLPQNLMPIHIAQLEVAAMTEEEKDAYQKIFAWRDKDKSGFLAAEVVKSVLVSTGLPLDILARIWNLSDVDRDGQLSSEEFAIALHLVRFCRKGNSLDGSINTMALLPRKNAQDSLDNKKQRLTEVQTEKRRFLSLKEKLCHEIAGGLTEDVISQNIRPELQRVEGQLHFLEKEENELRRALQHMKDRHKKDSFKPFDRSFLLKRRPCGEDIFRDAEKNLETVGSDNAFEEQIQKLLIVGNGPVCTGEPVTSETSLCSAEETQEEDTEAENTVNQEPGSSEHTVEVAVKERSPLENGVAEENASESEESNGVAAAKEDVCDTKAELEEERKSAELLNESSDMQAIRLEVTSKLDQQVPKRTENSNGSIDANSNSVKNELLNGHENTLTSSAKVSKEKDIIPETNSGPPVVCVNLNKLNEKFELLDKEHSVSDTSRFPVEEGAIVTKVASTAESSVEGNMNSLFEERNSEKKNGVLDENNGIDVKMRRQPTQEELIPFFLEEKKKKEEERKKKRLIEEEQLKRAKEERERLEEQRAQESKLSKASFKEEREKLERQTLSAAAAEKEQPSKTRLSRSQASMMVEKELEEQRIREVQTQMELERIKEIEKREMEKKKIKPSVKNEEHPVVIRKRSSIIEKAIFDDDGQPAQEQKSAVKLGNDQSEDEARRLAAARARESERAAEPQVVRRRPKPRSGNADEKANNRKSIVELEIERQRAREEDMKLENDKRQQEIERHKQAVQQSRTTTRRMSADSVESADKKNEEYEIQKQRELQEAKTKEQEARRIQELVRKQSQGDVIESPTVVESVNAPPQIIDEVDATLRQEKARQAEEEQKRLEEERERKRREDLEKVRKEALKREADELMREKRMKEEELRRKREAQLLEAEKRERERKEAQEQEGMEAHSRRASFHAHKIMLEQRVLKALQESSEQSDIVRRKASDDRKGKRLSLNIDDAPDFSGIQPEVRLRNKPEKKSGMRDRSTFYADEVVARKIKVAIDTGEGEGRLAEAIPKLSERRKQFEKASSLAPPSALDTGKTLQAGSVLPPAEHKDEQWQRRPRKVSSGDVVDAGEHGTPNIADDRIRRELEEQRRREEMLRKETEIREQEKRREMEVERIKMTSPVPPGQTVACVDEVKKVPPPNKLQVRKPSRSRDSLTQTMAAQWESFLSTKEAGLPTPKVQAPTNTERKPEEQKKSFIQLERERERQRELEVQQEREALLRERQRKIDENKAEKRRKEEEELEKKRRVVEEKEKRQQRTSAMKSMWERMSSKK